MALITMVATEAVNPVKIVIIIRLSCHYISLHGASHHGRHGGGQFHICQDYDHHTIEFHICQNYHRIIMTGGRQSGHHGEGHGGGRRHALAKGLKVGQKSC